MTNDNDDADTFERQMGPVRQVIRQAREVPLLPPREGETRPFMWTCDPAEVVSMDVDGRPVESVTLMAVGAGQMVVKFKDGGEITYDADAIRSTPEQP